MNSQKSAYVTAVVLVIVILVLIAVNFYIFKQKPQSIIAPQATVSNIAKGPVQTKYNTVGNITWESFSDSANQYEYADGMSIFLYARLFSYEIIPRGVVAYYRLSDGRVLRTHVDRMARISEDYPSGKYLNTPWGEALDEKTRIEAENIMSFIKSQSEFFPSSINISYMRSEDECLKLKFASPTECGRISRAPQKPLTLDQFEEDVRRLGKEVTTPDESESALVGAFEPNPDIARPWYLVQINGNLMD